MDQPVEANRWKRRWLLLIRAVYDRKRLVEVTDVAVVPLPEFWLGDFVEEGSCAPISDSAFSPEHVDVVQDSLDVLPTPGHSCPELGLYYDDGRWTVGE